MLYKYLMKLVLLLLACMLVSACAKQSSGPETYFSFDEDTGKSTVEVVTKKQYEIKYVFNDAKYKEPSSPIRSEGIHGYSLLFDGYSTYIDVDNYYNPKSNFTISVWIAPRAFECVQSGMSTGIISTLENGSGYELGVLQFGQLSFAIYTSNGIKSFITDEALDLYAWNHIVVSYSKKKLEIYKNDKMILDESNGDGEPLPSTGNLTIGRSKKQQTVENVFNANMFSGLIDEMEIYSSAFSAKDVTQKFNETIGNRSLDINKYKNFWLDYDILASDRYAPQYHLRAPQNWSNEMYGFFWSNGYYHAFAQQNPIGPYYNEGQRWGHFISKDLVHWESLVPALIPEDNGIDSQHVFSGSAILDNKGEPVLFYTGVDTKAKRLYQISAARAVDLNDQKLEQWDKLGTTILSQSNQTANEDLRDPFIYKENGVYYMLIGSTTPSKEKGAVYTYKATDDTLNSWEFLGETFSGNSLVNNSLGTFYELPNLYKIYNKDKTKSKYMLMFSPIGGKLNGSYYMLGNFDLNTGKFIPETKYANRIDLGPSSQVLCGSGFYDEHTGKNLFLTMSRVGNDDLPEERYKLGWSNVFTVVKEMYLSENGDLRFKPIDAYKDLQDKELINIENQDMSFQQVNEKLKDVSGDMLRINVTINPKNANKVGIYVKYDNATDEKTLISYDLKTKTFYIDNSKSSLKMWNNRSGGNVVEISNGSLVTLTIFIDRAMVEAFLDDYNEITVFGYNTSKNANGISMYAYGGNPSVVSIQIYSMASAYGKTENSYWG